ncbi:ABC transporter permease [Actinomadura syzygii]|uniref:ABC transporter permease n=1 Tax=Actinomadura syzygii TaxID=1427538 RepID=A0A5D0UNL0_9ACTN|nr:ABC transporter permease [Actinomadura syzygii]TYC18679.1 ABC transporter permease [Actinomadura syzygii]
MHERRKPVIVMVVASLIGMVFAGSFLGALHHTRPHDVPVAVVAPETDVHRLGVMLDRKEKGAFDLTAYASQDKARAALLNRDVDAVFVLGDGSVVGQGQGARLIVAGANGRIENGVLTEVFQGFGQAAGIQVAVEDVVPLPSDDNNGISSIFFVVTTAIPAVIMAVLFAFAVPTAGVGRRLALLLAGSVVLGGANVLVADAMLGALAGAPWALWGVTSLLVFAVASFTAGTLRAAGPPGAGLTALLLVPIGLPASGGPMGPHFIPQWYAACGEWLPPSAAISAVRNVVYFHGNALGRPLLVLGLWAAAGIALLLAPKRTQKQRETMTPTAPEPATST